MEKESDIEIPSILKLCKLLNNLPGELWRKWIWSFLALTLFFSILENKLSANTWHNSENQWLFNWVKIKNPTVLCHLPSKLLCDSRQKYLITFPENLLEASRRPACTIPSKSHVECWSLSKCSQENAGQDVTKYGACSFCQKTNFLSDGDSHPLWLHLWLQHYLDLFRGGINTSFIFSPKPTSRFSWYTWTFFPPQSTVCITALLSQ